MNVESVLMDIKGSGLTTILEDNSSVLGKFPFDLNISIKRLSSVELDEFIKDVSPEYLRFVPYANKEMNYRGDFTPKNTPDHVPATSLIAFFHFLPMHLIEKWEKTLKEAYVDYVREAEGKTTQFFTSKIRYLGPSRADPQAVQKLAPSSELDEVGAKGEHAAAAYHTNQNAIIRWFNPFTEATVESTLNIAMNTWIRYLGVAHEVKTQETGSGGVIWQVVHIEGRKALPLSAVGAGVSQILPILVMGLLAPDNTLLIIEESEIGLHPSAQARLGDFFMGLAKCSKQCLIETHSENIVSQLRIHIVKTGGKKMPTA